MIQDTGDFGPVFKWPIIGIHAILTPDNRVFTFGTDLEGRPGRQHVLRRLGPESQTSTTR